MATPTHTAPAAPALPLQMFLGFVNQWECDHIGHMNAMFYLNRAYHGWAAFAAAINLKSAFQREAPSTVLPREVHLRYHKEMRGGESAEMRGGVVDFTEDSVTLYQELRNPLNGDLNATFRIVLDHVEAQIGKPFPWPKKSRAPLEALRIAGIPEYGQARSIDLSLPANSGGLARALELGVPVAGLSMLIPAETDAFGRMLPQIAIGRQSDSFGGLLRQYTPDAAPILAAKGLPPTSSGAALEMRVVFRNWPRAGDQMQLHSAVVEAKGKTMRFRVWNVDPTGGECWIENEVVLAHFDMNTRKAYAAPPEYEAILNKHAIKGFTL